ncbi:MAG: copper amine oxidase N-terminal domain-containing protein [Oscillospiraceae bacterium]|nr:copper amine oxidase N-terminal domain-containing protein [Oscillospiraceae bacterium]
MMKKIIIILVAVVTVGFSVSIISDISEFPLFPKYPDEVNIELRYVKDPTELKKIKDDRKRRLAAGLSPYDCECKYKKSIMFIPIDKAEVIFYDTTLSINGDDITMVKKGYQYDTTLELQLNNKFLYINGEATEMEVAPFKTEGTIFIPIKYISDAFEYNFFYTPSSQTITFDYFDADIYIWNSEYEYVEGSVKYPGSLRYAVMQHTLEARGFDEISASSTADFQKIMNQLDDLKSFNSRVFIYSLYRTDGYKIPYDGLSYIESSIENVPGFSYDEKRKNIDDIPVIVKDFDDFRNEWYSEQIYALGESALFGNKEQEIYRFTQIGSFSNPFTIRIEINDDKTGILYFKQCDGPISVQAGNMIENKTKTLSSDEVEKLQDMIKKYRFWGIPKEDKIMGLDGFDWIIEGVTNGKYHIVTRWVPYYNDAVCKLGELFIELYGDESLDYYKEYAPNTD